MVTTADIVCAQLKDMMCLHGLLCYGFACTYRLISNKSSSLEYTRGLISVPFM